MSSKIKLDLKNFKHVKSSKDSTTLRHNDGHEITLSHGSLSPESRAQLESLSKIARNAETPLHSDAKKHMKEDKAKEAKAMPAMAGGPGSLPMAEGGRVPIPQPKEGKPTALPEKKAPHDIPANVNTPKSLGDAWDRVKNAWAEGGSVESGNPKLEESKKIPSCHACGGPIRMAEGGDVEDFGGVEEITGQKPGAIPPLTPKEMRESESQAAVENIRSSLDTAKKFLFGDPNSKEAKYLRGEIDSVDTPPTNLKPSLTISPSQAEENSKIDKEVQNNESYGKNLMAPASMSQTDVDNAPAIEASPESMGLGQGTSPSAISHADAPLNPDGSFRQPGAAPQVPAPQPQAQAQAPQPPPDSLAGRYKANMDFLTQHDKAFLDDHAAGHIKPETISSMYGKQDTVGKIGTVFGLLLSGIGSGLTKQPNAMLQQINNEINNDIEAQKKSAENAQNLLKINQQGLINEATAEDTMQSINAKAQALTWAQMAYGAFDAMAKDVAATPEGTPLRAQKEQALALMGSAMQAEKASVFSKAAAANAQAKMFFGDNSQGHTDPEQAFQQHIRGLKALGPQGEARAKDMEEKHLPGFQGSASIPIPKDVRDRVSAQVLYDKKAKEYVDYAKQHSMNWANLNPSQRLAISNRGATMAADLQSLYRKKIEGGVYKEGEQHFIEGIIPSQPAKWSASFNAIPKVEQTIHNNTDEMQNIAKSYGFPGQAASSAQPQEKMIRGVLYRVSPDGKSAVRVK